MKSKLILMCAMIGISLCPFACAPTSKQVSLRFSRDDFRKEQHISKQVAVPVDGTLTVTLYSCPSEGRQWSEAEVSDRSVMREVDHKYEHPTKAPSCMPPPGTPGQEVWTFEALKKGTGTVSMEYSRPWEGGEKGEWTFVLTVAVE